MLAREFRWTYTRLTGCITTLNKFVNNLKKNIFYQEIIHPFLFNLTLTDLNTKLYRSTAKVSESLGSEYCFKYSYLLLSYLNDIKHWRYQILKVPEAFRNHTSYESNIAACLSARWRYGHVYGDDSFRFHTEPHPAESGILYSTWFSSYEFHIFKNVL